MSATEYYDFTYSSAEYSINAVFGVVSDGGGEYTIVSITGNINDQPITALEPADGFQGNDNLLFTTSPYLDSFGVSFDTATDTYNIDYNGTTYFTSDPGGSDGGGSAGIELETTVSSAQGTITLADGAGLAVTATGTIQGSNSSGEYAVSDTGTIEALTNDGSIIDWAGIDAGGDLAMFVNDGLVQGTTGDAVDVTGTLDYLDNSGTILAGFVGVNVGSLGTLINSGLISATDSNAIYDTGSGYIDNTGTILGNEVYIFSGGTIENSGSIGSAGPYPAIEFTTDGTLILDAGSRITGDVSNGVSNGVLELNGDLSVTGIGTQYYGFASIVFNHADTSIEGYASGLESGQVITGFAQGDTIILDNVVANGGNYEPGTGLVLDNDGGTIDISGTYTTSQFEITNDGTNTTIELACFCTGARLLTERGYIAVEALREGENICTVSGALRPARWVGHRRVDLRRHPDARANSPIRIARDAFAEGVPARDLWVSPGHNIHWAGKLIYAAALVNGATIARIEAPAVEYWHVELDRHDLIFADGLATESYLDAGNRDAFDNGPAFSAVHPDFTPRPATGTCLPLVSAKEERAAIRAALLARAGELGWRWEREPDLHLLADGVRLGPAARDASRYRFAVPAGAARVELCSRTWIPAEATADSGDVRELGICVTGLRVDGRAAELHDLAGAQGWHAPEPNGPSAAWVWTQGRALLPAGLRELEVRTANREAVYLLPPAGPVPQLRVA